MSTLSTVIMAAGKGTRMKSDLPKVLHPLNGRAMIHYVIDVAEQLHSDKIILIIGHKRELVEKECAGRPVAFAIQAEQLGTGHAVKQTAPFFKDYEGDILVLSGDVPLLTADTLKELVTQHQNSGAVASLLTARLQDPTGYGRIIRDDKHHVKAIVEHKDATPEQLEIDEINVGIYIFKAGALFDALDHIKNDNAQGEYYLPDVIPLFLNAGKTVTAVVAQNFDETRGINTVEQLKEAEAILNNRS
ncbi:MAG: UDP-N-acetylglucosamine pyrophosphorylase [Calditrichaeota bacterium]|nr:MAG: UDP-N-acetylglucosamine pyrophosphorylase [Calditrichota bacterium]